ncbi:MAG: AAA family ATPase [Roseburia sp.]
MIATCSICGNHNWDKEVTGNQITCPKCGASWEFQKLPLFILTGCSGIGKTTTAQLLQREHNRFVILDADMFYNIMPHETDSDYYDQVEQIESLAKNISQSGYPVLWTMAGNIDKINQTYHRRFFEKVYVLALVASEADIRERMTNGRNITDAGWIQSSVDYNHYFMTHDIIGDMPYETLNTTGKSVEGVAAGVKDWLLSHLQKEP